MTLTRLVLREIRHRKTGFWLALASVSIAVACLLAAILAHRGHDLRTERIIAAKERETRQRMAKLEDDYRKITKGLGFNVLILPKDQNLSDLYADDYASKYMPEEYAHRLAQSKMVTVNHLLPSLQQKLRWPETQRTILLIGTRGEVPVLHRDPRRPILEPVPAGGMVVGYELHRSLHLEVGQRVKLLGREFTVSKLHEERGNKDDITIWIDLAAAQELLDKKGLINAILALECHCAAAQLDLVREEIARTLPDTQVIEYASKALARAETRTKAAQAAGAAIEAERNNRARLQQEQDAFASALVPIIVLGCIVWIGLLQLANVRERRTEIGILRALGLRSRDILGVFVGKAIVTGLGGAVIGVPIGFVVGALWGGVSFPSADAGELLDGWLFAITLVAAPALAVAASWAPALLAARQDPAVVLREE